MNGLDRSQCYGRMFPASTPTTAKGEEELKLLGQAMIDSGLGDKFGTVAGITYFGQFIDHDLTYDVTKLEERNVEPSEVRNFRTPRFDLELIYGDGSEESQRRLRDGDKLKLDQTVGVPERQIEGGTWRDIARNEAGEPLHADPNDTRNLENLLVMQIHVLFILFHNEAVERCHDDEFKRLPLPKETFERAQQLVRWHYQWLVREYFLRQIGHAKVLQDMDDANKPKTEWAEKGFFIPAEFSLAAFRFGHSMVRSEYLLNCHQKPLPLASLMAQTKKPERLREDWLIEWGNLFPELKRSTKKATTPSSAINTAIAEPLHRLDEYTRRQFSTKSDEPQPKELSVRTLLRGARARLPTGEEVAAELVRQKLLKEEDILGDRLTQKFEATNDLSREVLPTLRTLAGRTPLYYYLLKEAEVLGAKNNTLGPIGTRIVAEVVEAVLQADETSYLRTEGLGRNWQRPIWPFKEGGSGKLRTLGSLVRMLGDTLPNGCSATIHSRVRGAAACFCRQLGAIPRAVGFR
jgi:hypothetical protein